MTDRAAVTVAQLDTCDPARFTEVLGGLFEHSPWIAARAADGRPYHTAAALHDGLMAVVRALPQPEQVALIQAHPDLAGQEVTDKTLTASSAGEQGRLGFTALDATEHAALAELNARYRARFGFPCIIALARHATRETVFAEFRARLDASAENERLAAIDAIGHVTNARLARLLGQPAEPALRDV